MTAVHIVTDALPPTRGGLESWTERLAEILAADGHAVTAYVTGDAPVPDAEARSARGFEIVNLQPLRHPWEASLNASGWQGERLGIERARLNFLCLRNVMRPRLSRQAGDIVLSNFALSIGHLAHLVAREFDLPHVLAVVGTDFSRGFRNPRERAVLAEVAEAAAVVVTKSAEQLAAIDRDFHLREGLVIETGVDVGQTRWDSPDANDRVRIFSDGGFSYKKGSGVLIDAFLRLRDAGHRIALEICGATQEGQEDYWQARRAEATNRYPDDVGFFDYLPGEEVRTRLVRSHIYASATLGEGSSAGREKALCIGIPIVSTRCGELWLGVERWPHVRLVDVADAMGFEAALGDLCVDLASGGFTVDPRYGDEARLRFAPDRQWSAWCNVLKRVGK